MTLICSYFLAVGSLFAQTNVTFKFKVWKNSVSAANYLGEHTASTNGTNFYARTPTDITSLLEPGDELVIQNLCSLNGSQLSFNGTTKKATIGFTSKTGCSRVGPPADPNPLKHIADVCQGVSGCTTAPQSFNSWNWGSYITITLPSHSSTNTFLMFSYGIMGTPINSCGCGGRYSFTKINLAPGASTGNDPVLFSYLTHNEVYVQPNPTVTAQSARLMVFNRSTGGRVQTVPYRSGIKFRYIVGLEYDIIVQDPSFTHREIFKIPQVCKDGNKRNNVSNTTTTLNFESTTVSTFPNPTTGIVSIQLKDAETTETNIQVLNALGQVVLEKQVQNDTNIEVDLSKEISGIYILNIVNGNAKFTEKVIKE